MKGLVIAFAFFKALPAAHAWGVLGHETVASIASNFLLPETIVWAQDILNDTSSSYLAAVAAWADSYRVSPGGRWSAPLHFIDALDSPPETCNLQYTRDCGIGGCVVSALNNYTQRVQDATLPDSEINIALKFIVHFAGDIHQPLHDEHLDLGGNTIKVTFNGLHTNLHAVWDTSIPEAYAGNATLINAHIWGANLTEAINTGAYKSFKAGWLKGMDINDPITTTTTWAQGANAYVCTNVMPNGVGPINGTDLGTDYYERNLPVVQQQIATAGYRLAAWLNLIATGSTGLNDESSIITSEELIYHDDLRK